MTTSHWASQSAITKPGEDAIPAIDALSADISSLRQASSQLVLHYAACKSLVIPSRFPEIHTFYADAMFSHVLSRGAPATLDRQRSADDKTVGCCRDDTVLFLSMARHKNIPARARVGFAAYLREGWMIDHVVAEVWDGSEQRWRLIDPGMPASLVRKVNSQAVDWFDLRPDVDFQTGAEAWTALREKRVKPDHYVVAPELQVPDLRGAPYIAHNVVLDLAFMNKQEVLLWDSWGVLRDFETAEVPERHFPLLDEISRILLDRDVKPSAASALMAKSCLRIPEVVMRFDPNNPSQGPQEVNISRALAL